MKNKTCFYVFRIVLHLGSFAKATFSAVSRAYSSDFWKKKVFIQFPYKGFTDHLVKTQHQALVLATTQYFYTRKIK